jgi:hypothetical protein
LLLAGIFGGSQSSYKRGRKYYSKLERDIVGEKNIMYI